MTFILITFLQLQEINDPCQGWVASCKKGCGSNGEGIMKNEIDRLRKILNNSEQERIYTCIQDILANGIVSGRFESEESLPSRQDVTRFILVWLKEIGVSADRCRNWMIGYSTRVLSRISSSSPSRIRHSTKSLIKYIYRTDDVALNCGCEQNKLKADCDPDCPVYSQMQSKRRMDRLHETTNYDRPRIQAPPEPILSGKDRYKEQFDRAMAFVKDQLNKVSTLDEIKQCVNDQGFKTRTGKLWTTATLYREIKKHQLSFTSKIDKEVEAYRVVKAQYQEQYRHAVNLIAKLYHEGIQITEILDAMEAQHYKTITGRKWTEANIRHKISEIKKNGPDD